MKLVLKYDHVTKLYTDELDYSQIVAFVQEEMGLQPESLSIAYTDPEGDEIVVASDEDLAIMATLLEGKPYVKIHVSGTLSRTELSQSEIQIKVEELPEAPRKQEDTPKTKIREKVKANMEEENKLKEKKKKKSMGGLPLQKDQIRKAPEKKAKDDKLRKENQKKEKVDKVFENFSRLMGETITALVDERIRSLLPCIREQKQLSQDRKVEEREAILHEGCCCLVCSVQPITGVRYKCPKCPNVSLCQKCQPAFQHPHNLIKVRQLVETENSTLQRAIKQLYTQFFKGKVAQTPNTEEEAKQRVKSERIKSCCRELKLVFGGKLADYASVVSGNIEAPMPVIVAAYCLQNNLPEAQGSARYEQVLVDRLCKRFNKEDPEVLRSFAVEHINCQFKEIARLYAQLRQQEAKEKKKNQKRSVGRPLRPEEKIKTELAERDPAEPPPIDKCNRRSLQEAQKREIYEIMVDFYGPEREAEFPAFIDRHYKFGKDNIPQLWADTMSKISV